MTAPVVNRLRELSPGLRVTLRSAASRHKLDEHFREGFHHIDTALDLGMAMHDALSVNRDASYAYYSGLHRRWHHAVDEAAADLQRLAPDLLLGNIPYLSLAGAARAGIPSMALNCLNWADIFRHYCHDRGDAAAIEGQIRDAYDAAAVFLAPAPSMPMPGLQRRVSIGPIARVGRGSGDEIRERLGVDRGTKLALLSLGGFGFDLDLGRWPRLPGWRVLTGMPVRGEHPDVVAVDRLDLAYIDLFASVDAVVTKLGYGTVAEAAVNGRPVLYVPRDGWPEEPCLADWLSEHGRCVAMPLASLMSGNIVPILEDLSERAAPARPLPSGIDEAARRVLQALSIRT